MSTLTSTWAELKPHKGKGLQSLIMKAVPSPRRRVLVLVDHPLHVADDYGDRILGSDAVPTYRRIIAHLCRERSCEKTEWILSCPPKAGDRSSLIEETFRLIKAVRPDVVLLAGYRISRALSTHEDKKPYFYFSRLRRIKGSMRTLRGPLRYAFNCIETVPLRDIVDPEPPVKGDNGGGGVNLLGSFMFAAQTAARGSNLYDITPKVSVDHTFVGDMTSFKKLMSALRTARIVSIDTETYNLNKRANGILTMQLTVANLKGSGYRSYFLPLNHRENPWLPDELKRIKTKLRSYFERGNSQYHVYQNAKFDLTQIRNYFGVRYYKHAVYDVSAGEYVLDENIKWYSGLNIKAYALDAIERRYGFVRPKTGVDKEDRSDMDRKKLVDLREYGVLDTVTTLLISRCQIAEAKRRGYGKFVKLVTDQIGAMTHVMTDMEYNGMPVDATYLQSLVMPNSDVNKTINEVAGRYRKSKAVIRLNDKLLGNANWRPRGLFGEVAKPWLFNLHDTTHVSRLFFEELKLKPLRRGKSGKASVDKGFQKVYKSVPEVAWFTELSALGKLKSAFIDALHRRVLEDEDSRISGHIHASYDYRFIVTGRSASFNPNMQQMPSRGKLAKIVKRIFIAAPGCILIKTDFAAHEIRMLGNITRDPRIKSLFDTANEALRRLRIAKPEQVEELFKILKRDGDVHILNVKRFYGLEVDKSHPLRTSVKTAVFSSVYGATAFNVAQQMREGTVDAVKDESAKLYKEGKAIKSGEIKLSPEEAEKRLQAIRMKLAENNAIINRTDDEWLEMAEETLNKLWSDWSVAAEWIQRVHRRTANQLTVHGPTGRVRHLWAALHANEKVQAAMNRRGPNSIIQGLASDIGYMAGRLISREVWRSFVSNGLPAPLSQSNAVHDSMVQQVPLYMLGPASYLMEHGMTTMVMNHYRRVYGLDMQIPLGMELGFGPNEAEIVEWKDMRFDTLRRGAEALCDKVKASKEVTRATLHNIDVIADVRRGELRKNPYEMRLENNSTWYKKHLMLPT